MAASYCYPCNRHFVNDSALRQHLLSSSMHAASSETTSTESPDDWDDSEHVCSECGNEYENDNNLRQHRITHRPANVECYGCYRTFTTYSGMILHLEAGTCVSGIDILDLNESAAMCFQWRKWTLPEYRYELLNRVPLDQGIRAFKCPNCENEFPKLSSLFMHVATQACDQMMNEGAIEKLTRWLWNRHESS